MNSFLHRGAPSEHAVELELARHAALDLEQPAPPRGLVAHVCQQRRSRAKSSGLVR